MGRPARAANGSVQPWWKLLMPPRTARTPYHRLALRRGKKRAAVALAHPFLIIVYHVLANAQDYQELGATYFDELTRDKKE